MTDTMQAPSRLSYSSLNSYAECGERWRLERGHKIASGTWWATLAGSVIHELTEVWDRGHISEGTVTNPITFEIHLDAEVAKAKERGNEIKASGTLLKKHGKTGGPGKKDRDWWLIEGPLMIASYITWRKLTKWKIPTMWDGQLGIEIRLESPFADRAHLGFIDRVFERPDGELVIVDIKSGKEPASKLQLGVYRAAIAKQYGLDVQYGAYWMAGTGDIVGLWDLTDYSVDYIEAQYEMAWRGIEAGVFLPSVTNMCKGCGVRDYCRAVGGKKADEKGLPLIETVGLRPGLTKKDVSQLTAI